MRKIWAALLAVPVIVFVYLTALLRRNVLLKLGILACAVALVVSGLVVGLPTKQTAAGLGTTFAPLGPAAFEVKIPADLGVDEAVEIDFAKAMDRASVEQEVRLDPAVDARFSWDTADRVLTIRPFTHWAPDTYYTVSIGGGARDQMGLPLAQPVHVPFRTGSLTTGLFSVTTTADGLVPPATAFTLTFDRPVALAAIQDGIYFEPPVPFKVGGDDAFDVNSHVFTIQPLEPLAAGTAYTIGLAPATRDRRGVEMTDVPPLAVKTLDGPGVIRFRPRDKSTGIDPGQALSVRFSEPMDTIATSAAFTATAGGNAVTGKMRWTENDTVLVLTPAAALPGGAQVTLTVTTDAASKTGIHLEAAVSATFSVTKPPAAPPTPAPTPAPKAKTIPPASGGGSLGSAPWYSSEMYYLRLMNCTRTGGWVTSSGACSSVGHHTLPAQSALPVDKGISDRVARPFAKYMADRGILDHYADGSPKDRFLRAGYHPGAWGENIGSPYSLTGGLIHDETFFQNEYACRCSHYANIMSPKFDRAGIGIWISHGRIRLVIDFYHP